MYAALSFSVGLLNLRQKVFCFLLFDRFRYQLLESRLLGLVTASLNATLLSVNRCMAARTRDMLT
jgi:hypothetical protein